MQSADLWTASLISYPVVLTSPLAGMPPAPARPYDGPLAVGGEISTPSVPLTPPPRLTS